MRRCWTCNTEHDLDMACPASDTVRSMRAAGAPDHTSPDLFDDACCGEGIVPGEDIRADGFGGWIHADTICEKLAS
jgi:hypothetical protein